MSRQGESIPALWLAIQGQDGALLPTMDNSRWPAKKFPESHVILKYVLLTKRLWSRWLDIGLFLFMRVYGLQLRLGLYTRKTNILVQYPGILSSCFIINSSLRDNSSIFHFLALDLLLRQAQKSSGLLKGHQRTVQYLQHLGNVRMKELLLSYSFWYITNSCIYTL